MSLIIFLVVSLANAQENSTTVLTPGQIFAPEDTVFVISNEKMDTLLYVLKDYSLLEKERDVLDSLNVENQKILVLKDSLLDICSLKDSTSNERIQIRDQRIVDLRKEKKWVFLKGALYGVLAVAVIQTLIGR